MMHKESIQIYRYPSDLVIRMAIAYLSGSDEMGMLRRNEERVERVSCGHEAGLRPRMWLSVVYCMVCDDEISSSERQKSLTALLETSRKREGSCYVADTRRERASQLG